MRTFSGSLTRSLDILDDLTHAMDAWILKKVSVPSLEGSHVVEGIWIGHDRTWRDSVVGKHVFVKGHAGAKCTDAREPGRNEGTAKIAEVIAHLVVRLSAFRVKT